MHGKCYVADNPTFENVVADEETREALVNAGHVEALNLRTKAKAESELGEFFGEYIREWHPCKDDQGENLFPFVQEILAEPELAQPQCTNLLAVLDEIFDVDQPSVNLCPLARLVTALIEDGQRHTGHGTQAPVLGTDPCARKGSSSRGTSYVYCRYLFPRL